ncbi:Zinc finger BED domain-containing protein 4 [Merluccius polli]|uniref:Zinc finger BED domain-containing protein 4 n=1 Tax=Merluccius polli TaxID=89951 RepID=A0AA47NVR4_MERPO|nr:Zinc finger BED domain-containing protein 4 [Merluccius polli]
MTGRKKSAVWNYFSQSGQSGICNICKANISFKGGSTANLQRHLKTRHPGVRREEEAPPEAPSEAPLAGSSQQPSTSGDSRGRGQAMGQSRMTQFMSRPITPQRQKTLDEQLAKMVVWDLQPFSFVEDRGFKAFTNALNPSYTLPGRKT